MQKDNYLVASKTPEKDVELVSYVGQDPRKKMYKSGYEIYFEEMPVLVEDDPLFEQKAYLSKVVMQQLGKRLVQKADWLKTNVPGVGEFFRNIVAMEPPVLLDDEVKEGAEFVVAQWGDGFTSPVHGHATGYMHEEVLFGKVLVNSYRMVNPTSTVVRPVKTEIVTEGTFVSEYAPHSEANPFKRQTLIHNFTSIGYSATLHYLPEHVRDGRDNQFTVQHFDDVFSYKEGEDLTQITAQQGFSLKPGDVALVRSSNVPEYGDHYIVITGPVVVKEHGIRPQDTSIAAPKASKILDKYTPIQGLTLLKLNDAAKAYFLEFHGITVENNKVTFPTA